MNGATIQQNADIQQIVFSEPVRGADNPANYVFGGTGGAGIYVSQVTAIDDRTYNIVVSGSLIGGPVTLSFSGITDWAGNPFTETLSFVANVGIVVTISPAGMIGGRFYVSATPGANTSQNVTWQSDTLANQPGDKYYVSVVAPGAGCAASSNIGISGQVNLTGSDIVTAISHTHMAAPGNYDICIFVDKVSAPAKTGSASAPITRDDALPTQVANPVSGSTVNAAFNQIDVTYSETVQNATTPANYVLSGPGKGSLSTNPTSVSSCGVNCQRLVFSGAPVSGALTLTISGITDNALNPLSGTTVNVGGDFTHIGGQARNRLAAIDATTGTAW